MWKVILAPNMLGPEENSKQFVICNDFLGIHAFCHINDKITFIALFLLVDGEWIILGFARHRCEKSHRALQP